MSMTPQPVDHLIGLARALETARVFFLNNFSLTIFRFLEMGHFTFHYVLDYQK